MALPEFSPLHHGLLSISSGFAPAVSAGGMEATSPFCTSLRREKRYRSGHPQHNGYSCLPVLFESLISGQATGRVRLLAQEHPVNIYG
jgi:hypothetical protein